MADIVYLFGQMKVLLCTLFLFLTRRQERQLAFVRQDHCANDSFSFVLLCLARYNSSTSYSNVTRHTSVSFQNQFGSPDGQKGPLIFILTRCKELQSYYHRNKAADLDINDVSRKALREQILPHIFYETTRHVIFI